MSAPSGSRLLPLIAPGIAPPGELETILLGAGDVLVATDEAVDYIYFVDEGLVTLTAGTSAGQSVEVATLGREGIVGAVACLGLETIPFEARVQVGGSARRLPARHLCDQLGAQATPLTATVLRYLQYEFCQITQSAACSRFHTSDQRLAKWLVLAAERLEVAMLPLTHEAISQLVGGPRHEVSRDLAKLTDAGAIKRGRGYLEVLDAGALRARACECYARIDGAYARLIAGLR